MEAQIKYWLIGFGSLFAISLGGQAWNAFEISRMDNNIQRQLRGELNQKEQLLTALNERLGMFESQMLTRAQLAEKAEEIISGLGEQTHDEIERYMEATGSEIEQISSQMTRAVGEVRGGSSRVRTPPTPAPPRVDPQTAPSPISSRDVGLCRNDPSKCDQFFYEWRSSYQVGGEPMATLLLPDFWNPEGDSNLRLNLAFKVTSITFRQARGEGVLKNQGVLVQAGYYDEEGEFHQVASSEMRAEDNGVDNRLFYLPTETVEPNLSLNWFEPSILAGVSYRIGGGFGLAAGAGLLNWGGFRFGGLGVIDEEHIGAGLFTSYHPSLLGKELNIAPFAAVSWGIFGEMGTPSVSAGLLFQVW